MASYCFLDIVWKSGNKDAWHELCLFNERWSHLTSRIHLLGVSYLILRFLFIKSDSNAAQKAKGLDRAIDIVHYYTAMYYAILTHQPFCVALKDI